MKLCIEWLLQKVPLKYHLFFSNDYSIFFKENSLESRVLRRFSLNFPRHWDKLLIMRNLSCFVVNMLKGTRKRFQGDIWVFLLLWEEGKKEILGYIRDDCAQNSKLEQQINVCSSKEILLKNIIQVIPTFAMSVFMLPRELSKDIEKIMNSFWWGNTYKDGKDIRWKAWDQLCTPKRFFWHGIQEVGEFYIAMLSKQAYRFIQFLNFGY